jgi:NADH:ubiquinone oxidoreductase subunit 5 (subunit L)/multisubunit Na+/H+ antiporter MnhA subunit
MGLAVSAYRQRHISFYLLPEIDGKPTLMFSFQLVIRLFFEQVRGVTEPRHSAEAKLALVKPKVLLVLCLLWLAD